MNTQDQIYYFEEINAGMQMENKGTLEINKSIEKLRDVTQHTVKGIRKLYIEIDEAGKENAELILIIASIILKSTRK